MTPDRKRTLVLGYYQRGWNPRYAVIHAYCFGMKISLREYLEILREYVDSQDETRDLGRRRK